MKLADDIIFQSLNVRASFFYYLSETLNRHINSRFSSTLPSFQTTMSKSKTFQPFPQLSQRSRLRSIYFEVHRSNTIHQLFYLFRLLIFLCHLLGNCLGNFSLCIKLTCLLYTSPSPRDLSTSRMPSSA